MKKIYQIPEIEVLVNEEFCQEDLSDNPGEVTPNGNENRIFDRSDVGNEDDAPALWNN